MAIRSYCIAQYCGHYATY